MDSNQNTFQAEKWQQEKARLEQLIAEKTAVLAIKIGN